MKTHKISRIRIRQSGISYDKNTHLARSIESSLLKDDIQTLYLEVAVSPTNAVDKLISNFQSVYPAVHGEYVYIGYDNGSLAPDAFSRALSILDGNTNIGSCALGALPFGAAQKPIFTSGALPTLESLKSGLPLKYNPLSLLSLFVFRKSIFDSLLSELVSQKPKNYDDVTSILHALLSKINTDYSLYSLELITLHPFHTSSTLLDKAITHINNNNSAEALRLLDAASLFNEEPGIPYYKAMALSQLGQFTLAGMCLEENLRQFPHHDKSLELQNLIRAEIPAPHQRTFDHVIDLWREAPGALSDNEGRGLFDRVQSLPDDAVILELGTGEGRSTLAMALACAGTNRRIFTIDLFRYYDDYFDVFQTSIRRFYLEQYVTPLIGNCHEILANWGDKPRIDFAFIDADHEYESVRKDYELCYDLAKPNGWIGFHDITPSWGGPTRLWEEEVKHVLEDTTQSDMFACGRKVPGKPRMSTIPPFNWHKTLIHILRDGHPALPYPDSCLWAMAMELSSQPLTDETASWCFHADAIIGYAPDYIRQVVLNWSTRKDQGDAMNDGYARLWYALICEHRGDRETAKEHYKAAMTVSRPLPRERVEAHLKRQED